MKKILAICLAIVIVMGLAACGGKTEVKEEKIEIGYACSTMAHEWYSIIGNGAKRRAEDRGVELTIADPAMDSSKQVSYIENFITQEVDAMIITAVDPATVGAVTTQAKDAGIPIVCESVALDCQDAYVGIADYEAAFGAGVWMGENATEDLKVLVVGQPVYQACRDRVSGFLDGLKSTGATYEVVQEVDGNGAKEDSLAVCTDALTAHPDVNVIFGINDNSATGGMNAYIEQGLDQSKLTVIGFGFEGAVGRDALLGDTPYKAAVAMFPEYVGAKIIDAAIDAAKGEEQELYLVPTVVITAENFDQFYTQDEEGNYLTNFEAIDKLLAEQSK